MASKMLLFIISATVAWNAVNCKVRFGRTNSTDDIKGFELANYTAINLRFKNKYMGEGKSYVKWQKLNELKPTDFSAVCDKYALMLSNDPKLKVKAEGKKSYRDRYTVMGFGDTETVEVDTITCLIKFLDKKGNVGSRMKYYLTEGDEPNSAFRFALIQTTMVLTRFLTDIWSKEDKTSDFNVRLKIRIYNTTTKATTTKHTKATTKSGGGTKAPNANATEAAAVQTTTKGGKKKSKKT